MTIGIPKEIKEQEQRVGLLPSTTQALVARGHTVLVQKNAGVGSGYPDEEYSKAGARIVEPAQEIFQQADMLGYLGFVVEIAEMQGEGENLTLQIYTEESRRLIGRNGEMLEAIQFLLNRLLQTKDKDAPKVIVDCEHYRSMDTAPRGEIVDRVRNAAIAVPGVIEIEKSFVRKMGLSFYVDLHVRVDARITVREGHDIAHRVKRAIQETDGRIADVLVHIEPAG